MKSLFTVASFTIKEMVKKKSFIVSNIIFLIIILVGTNIPRIINNFNNGDGSLTKLLIVDENNKFNGSLDSLKENDIGYDISIVNEKYDENYIPDFYIKNKKPIIIEYFGMYNETNRNKIFIDYNKKTERKIEFFNSLKDYVFIAIFPQDLKNNFEGLKNKLRLIL